MKKSERLNDMMIFLKDKNAFTLKDIMEKYNMSRSSALRDINALEEIGMPVYSQPGRNGGYRLLPNRLLSPVVFTVDELYALYFAMLTLGAYRSTPFHLSAEKLKLKFEACLPKKQMDSLRKMKTIFGFNAVQHPNASACLKDVLQSAIEEKPCEIGYGKREAQTRYVVQFFDISSAYGQWYGTAYNFETKNVQVFRCDKILSIGDSDRFDGKPMEDFRCSADKLYRGNAATEFQAHITEKGVDLFYKEHYPSMQLYSESGAYIIKGFYNRGEERFIADYLIHYGECVQKVEPPALRALIRERLNSLLHKYQ